MSDSNAAQDLVPGVQTFDRGSDGYTRATSPRNASAKQHPRLVVVPNSVDEVAAAVRYAGANKLCVVPQATGHGASGELGDDVLLVDTSALNTIHIDRERRVARVGAGAQWGAVGAEAGKSGLLGRAGSAPDVAVSGFTFGGGAGWLTRPHGLAAGSLISVDYVDGAGNIRRAADDAEDEVDRLAIWAYRGGGGVGIAATLEFGLVPVDDLWAGYMLWPIEALDAVVSAWAGAVPDFGEALATSISILHAPPAPPIPESLRGKPVVHLAFASSAGAEQATALRKSLADAPAPDADTWGTADVERLGAIHLDPPVATTAIGMARWLDDSTPSVALDILSVARDSPIQMVEIRNVGNDAIARDGASSAVPGGFIVHAVGDAEDAEDVPALEAGFAAVRKAATTADIGRTVGSWADGRSTVPDALPSEVRDRVIAICAMVDPGNVIARSRFIASDEAPSN